MNIRQAAQDAVDNVAVDNPEFVNDTTYLFKNKDGTYSVADNGEEVDYLTASEAIDIIVENLEADAE